jgi:hypothetical protein
MNRILILMAAVLLVAGAQPAQSQMVCGKRVDIVKALEDGHSEQRSAAGISGNGGLVELFTAGNGTWTLLLTMPGGPTCLLGSGEEWEGFDAKKLPGKNRSTAIESTIDNT